MRHQKSIPVQLSVVRYLQFLFVLWVAPCELLVLKIKGRHLISAMSGMTDFWMIWNKSALQRRRVQSGRLKGVKVDGPVKPSTCVFLTVHFRRISAHVFASKYLRYKRVGLWEIITIVCITIHKKTFLKKIILWIFKNLLHKWNVLS